MEIDGTRDLGLDYLSGLTTGSATGDPDLMNKCIDRNDKKYRLSATANSELLGQLLSTAGNKHQYRMVLTDENSFNPQTGEVEEPSWVDGILKRWNLSRRDGAIARYNLSIGKMKIKGEIPDNGTVTLEPEVNLNPLKEQINNQISKLQSDLLIEQSKLGDMEREIERGEKSLKKAKDLLQEEQSKSPPSSFLVNIYKGQAESLEKGLKSARGNLEAKKDLTTKFQDKNKYFATAENRSVG